MLAALADTLGSVPSTHISHLLVLAPPAPAGPTPSSGLLVRLHACMRVVHKPHTCTS